MRPSPFWEIRSFDGSHSSFCKREHNSPAFSRFVPLGKNKKKKKKNKSPLCRFLNRSFNLESFTILVGG